MNNRKEFMELIERYETITLEEIEATFELFGAIGAAKRLTGFGNPFTCSPCQAVKAKTGYECDSCEWFINTNSGCMEFENKYTYSPIMTATTPQDLLTAYRARAAYMRECLAGETS